MTNLSSVFATQRCSAAMLMTIYLRFVILLRGKAARKHFHDNFFIENVRPARPLGEMFISCFRFPPKALVYILHDTFVRFD